MTKQTFIVTQSERKTMINFIYKNLERPTYIPIHLDYGVWLNDKSVGKLRELVINACEIIEINCAAGSLAWQDAIEKFPKIFDDNCDVIVGEELQLETDQNYVTLIVLSDGTFMDVADAKMILVKTEQYEEVCNLGGSGHDFNPLASIDLSNLNIIPNFA